MTFIKLSKIYLKYLVRSALSALALIFALPLIPSAVALVFGNSISNAYIFSGLFMIGLVSRFYFCIFIAPMILIGIDKFDFFKKHKDKSSLMLILIFTFVAIWGMGFAFFYSNALLSGSWKSQVQLAQFFNKNEQKKIADALCDQVKGDLDVDGKPLEQAIAEINQVSKDAGFKLSTEDRYIGRGYITYFFKPTTSDNLETVKSNAVEVFKKNFIGPTYSWLNIDWYKDYIKEGGYRDSNQLMDIKDGFIRIRYETLFPLLNDFVTKGVLKTPPPHVLKAAKEAGLEFVKSERRDPIVYIYSVPVPFFQLFGGYFNLHYSLWGTRTEEGYKQVELGKVGCLWPRYGLKGSQPGYPPSGKIKYPTMPVDVPSCGEYATWLHCQNGSDSSACGREQFKKGALAPVCPPEKLSFPEEIYRTQKSDRAN